MSRAQQLVASYRFARRLGCSVVTAIVIAVGHAFEDLWDQRKRKKPEGAP